MSIMLSVKNFTVRCEGKIIVNNVFLDVHAGEIHVVLGPNGSGKSTLLSALMGHPAYEVVDGNIMFHDEDITKIPTEKKAERGIFFAPQHAPKIDGVTMLAFLHHAYRAIKKSEISVPDFYKSLTAKIKEYDLDENLLKRFVNVGFSGGEKKRGEIIQLLALEPSVALLDEIDSGVDIDSLQKVFAVIEALRKKRTGFLIVTHLSTILAHVVPDRVSVMKGGEIVQTGGVELARKILIKGFEHT
jgi:Fe-S cluster assembly ATP-binding protein